MTRSIKHFLLFYLLLSITLTSSLTALGNYFLDNRIIQQHASTQLEHAASFLDALAGQNPSTDYLQALQKRINTLPLTTRGVEFQIWNSQGELILHSHNTSLIPHDANKSGLVRSINDGHTWLTMTIPKTQLNNNKVTVAMHDDSQAELKQQITWVNLFMLLWSYPLLGILIWFIIDRALLILQKLTANLTSRSATRFDDIDINNAPKEIKPLIKALNRLFYRLQEAFERNKRFAADAAHELRTPLAALKTQAQVALRSPTEDQRKDGLRNVIAGVDRCTHIVQQLLILSRLEPENALHDPHTFDLAKLVTELVAQLVPNALDKNIDIELDQPESHSVIMYGSETAISILVRNLVDNAIRYTPENGAVHVRVAETVQEAILTVTDNGPGIAQELRSRIFERFYRVLGTQASGSGLGLAIVKQIAQLHQARIILSKPEQSSGLIIEIRFPKPQSLQQLNT